MKIAKLFVHMRKHTMLTRMTQEWRERMRKRRTAWWESRKGKCEYFEAKLESGIRMRFHLDSELAKLIYCDCYELTERGFLNSFLRSGDIFVDVGANVGLYSLIAARCVGPSGKIYAFEPTHKIYGRLFDNVNLNGFNNIRCFQLALSDKKDVAPFYLSEDGHDAWNSFAPPIAGHSFSKEMIHCETWDNFASQHALFGKITMMKLDVEGWETRFLSGASRFLSRNDAPLLQVEFTDEAARAAGSSSKALYHALEDLGYRIYTYDFKDRKLRSDPVRDSYVYLNLFATKNANWVAARLRGKRL
jgi:FkbM family methyltransferase